MRIIGPPWYKPEVTCLAWPEPGQLWPSEAMQKARLASERRKMARDTQRRREARLRCPDCGDSMKIRLNRSWRCRHCLGPMYP